MKIRDEAEVWADGYGFVEFQRTGTGLVPYHHESDPVKTTLPVATVLMAAGIDDTGATCILLA